MNTFWAVDFRSPKWVRRPLSDAEAWSSSSTCWSISTRRDDSGCSRPSQTICTSADGEWGNRDFLGYGYGSIPIDTFFVGWTSIYQLFWCSPGVQGFDTLPYGNPKPWVPLILPTLGWFWDTPHDFPWFFDKSVRTAERCSKELPFEQRMNMKTSTQSCLLKTPWRIPVAIGIGWMLLMDLGHLLIVVDDGW